MFTLEEVIKMFEDTWVCPSVDEANEYCEMMVARDAALHYLKEFKRISARLEKIALGNIMETLEKLDNPALTMEYFSKQIDTEPIWCEKLGEWYLFLAYVYNYEGKPRTNEADIALDIWAKLDGRREDTNFSMSREPLVQVKEIKE